MMRALRQDEISIGDRSALIQEAFRIEYMTIAWMVIEAAVAIGSAIAADSLTLLAFGFDSLIELASAGVSVWRLTVELRHGQTFAESAERRAARLAEPCCSRLPFMLLQASAGNYGCGREQSSSLPGLVISVLAMPTMYFLSGASSIWRRRWKPRAARRCGREHPVRSALAHRSGW